MFVFATNQSEYGTDLQFPDLRLLSGYKSTVVYANECIVKTQLAQKLITKHSIHDLIRAHGVDRVDAFIKGKRAITSYSNQIIEIDGLDGAKNLDSTFSLDDNSRISFREYYANKKDNYGNPVQLLEHNEEALVVHHRYSGRGANKRNVLVSQCQWQCRDHHECRL